MYVLLTDILDTFGDLVFERIKRKGIDVVNALTKAKTAVSLPVNFKHTDVSASAQETCRNWFYKTACSSTTFLHVGRSFSVVRSVRCSV